MERPTPGYPESTNQEKERVRKQERFIDEVLASPDVQAALRQALLPVRYELKNCIDEIKRLKKEYLALQSSLGGKRRSMREIWSEDNPLNRIGSRYEAAEVRRDNYMEEVIEELKKILQLEMVERIKEEDQADIFQSMLERPVIIHLKLVEFIEREITPPDAPEQSEAA